MGFLNEQFLGIQFWLWSLMAISIGTVVGAIVYVYQEKLKKTYYTLRWPEKVIRMIIHYPGNYFKEYWRLIPDGRFLKIDQTQYLYDEKVISRDSDMYAVLPDPNKTKQADFLVVNNHHFLTVDKKGKQMLQIDETESYEFDALFQLKKRGRRYSEIHYIYNNPFPLNFNEVEKKLEFTSQNLAELQKNDLFEKLLTLKGEKGMMMILVVLVVANLLATGFLIGKYMELF